MFSFINVEEERKRGVEEEEEERRKIREGGAGMVRRRMDVIDWLKDEKLSHPFHMRSAYAVPEG
eukprot:13943563-Ditylum_brightwellii.AAC.1